MRVSRPLLVVNLAAVGALAFLLWPGVVQREGSSSSAQADQELALQALQEANQRLARGLDEAVCRPDGSFGPLQPEEAFSAPIEPRRAPTRDGGSTVSLAEAMERGVALILSSSGSGTGFLINADHLVTNHHVVGDDDEVLVVNKHLGRVLRAAVVARSPGEPIKEHLDFALLKLAENPAELRPFALSAAHGRLDEVFAAGFPGFLITRDAGLQALREGDMSAAPEIISTVGNIVRPAQMEGQASYILHSAEVAPGNSGGPLIDACGRAIGVNTLVGAQDEARAFRTSLALDGEQTARFLNTYGASFRLEESVCQSGAASADAEARP